MIPIKLQLRNFLSYGEDVEPLDFTSFKLACLTGRNGHGKSALLDAMTWAIWGEARKAGYSRTPDSDLLRQNADEMFVEFTFCLNDQEYQVFRAFHRKRRTGKLEFRAKPLGEDQFILMTGSNKRETQKQIQQVLGLDYRTFVSSSFLQQGKADEFTRQSPKERKDILCSILGLDIYDRLLDETRRRYSEIRAEKRTLEDAIGKLENELTSEEEIKEQKNQLTSTLEEKESEIDSLRKNLQKLLQKLTELNHIQGQIEQYKEKEADLNKRLEDLWSRKNKSQKEWDDSQKWIKQEKTIKKNWERYEQISEELQQLLDIEEQFQQLNSQRQNIKEKIDEERNALEIQKAQIQTRQIQIQSDLNECKPILDAQDQIEQEYAAYQKTLDQYQSLEKIKPRYESLQQKLQDIEKQIDQERQKIKEQIASLRGSTQDLDTLKKDIQKLEQQVKHKSSLEQSLLRVKEELQSIKEQGDKNNRLKEQAAAQVKQCEKSLKETREKLDLLQSGKSQICPLCESTLDSKKHDSLVARFQNELNALQEQKSDSTSEVKEREKQRETLLQKHQEKEKERSELDRQISALLAHEKELEAKKIESTEKSKQAKQIEELTTQLETEQFAISLRNQEKQVQVEIEQTGFDPERFSTVDKQLKNQRTFEDKWKRLQELTQKSIEWKKQENELTKELALIQEKLEQEKFALEAKKQLQEIQQKIEPIEKSLAQRKPLQTEQQQLKNAPTDFQSLQQAQKRLPEIEQELNQWERDQKDSQEQIRQIQQSRRELETQLEQEKLDSLQKDHTQQESCLKEKEKERDQLQITLGGVEEKLKQIQTYKDDLLTKQALLSSAQENERHYKILTTAFSRNGIPAMIVDQSLPELQNDANALLHRLTNGRCSVALQSQREKKTGGMSETLDIKISDEMGTRDYEMFSGGEAFRTDLALRIALSHLLCRRAGSKLQLLVVDEGFGTQDNDGLANIVDAINEIQDEFEKILVVTHLEELKEKFQVRIEVTKELGQGSRFDLVHTL